VSAYGDLLYDRLSPLAWADAEHGFALKHLCDAIGAMHDPVHGMVSPDEGPPWSPLLDPDRAPAAFLPWLAQVVGERVPAGESETASRERIRLPQGVRRGKVSALIAAAQRTLTGTKFVQVLERTSSAYTLSVVTLTAETPDAAQTNRDLQAAKPAGLILTHVVTSVTIVDALAGTVDGLAGTVDAL
jgi:Phage tail protein (Tail_P2_I)